MRGRHAMRIEPLAIRCSQSRLVVGRYACLSGYADTNSGCKHHGHGEERGRRKLFHETPSQSLNTALIWGKHWLHVRSTLKEPEYRSGTPRHSVKQTKRDKTSERSTPRIGIFQGSLFGPKSRSGPHA